MSQQMSDFIKVPTSAAGTQTMPVVTENRLPESAISIMLCDEKDAEKIAEGMYICFAEAFWDETEPLEMRPPEHSTRVRRLAKRILPSFTNPNMKWLKAVLTSSGEIVGIAGWMGPGNHPSIHNIFRRSAIEFYGWKDMMGWSDEEIEEMWTHVSDENWNGKIEKDDEIRKELLGDEPHWYLAPFFTWPEYQGRGVGKRIMDWAIRQADATEPFTPMYLESAPMARAVYMHCGFVPQGAVNFLRRGTAVVRGLEAEDEEENIDDALRKGELEGANVELVVKDTVAKVAG